MKRRTLLTQAASIGVLSSLPACKRVLPRGAGSSGGAMPADLLFVTMRDRYFLRTLEFNPVISTYLGGGGYDRSLEGLDGRLRDYRMAALDRERTYYEEVRAEWAAVDAEGLSPALRIDHRIMGDQIGFVLHQHERRYWERCVDTYVEEPFRGIDWQIQQMTPGENGSLGTAREWDLVIARAEEVPEFLAVAKENLAASKVSGNPPDRRLIQKDGIEASRELASYFGKTLPETAAAWCGERPFAKSVVGRLEKAGAQSAAGAAEFAKFLEEYFAPSKDREDRYASGEAEYEWRVKNALRVDMGAEDLWKLGAAEVDRYEREMFAVAEKIAGRRKLGLAFEGDQARRESTRAVMDLLAKDAPGSDAELFERYREACARSVEYGRDQKMFEIPAGYEVTVVETPPVLRNAIDAAYYPAPPFKDVGTGQFYLTPTGDDVERLKLHTQGYIADTAVHEGFPGHDWNYVFMNANAKGISNVRWGTPLSVETSASMWQDSMAAEGWGLYAEELMAEPSPGRPHGFYTEEEFLFELQGQQLRAARIRLDVGLHTGRMSYEEALDYYSLHVNLFPDACARAAKGDETAKAMCHDAEHQIHRYSKWPTQAITYMLGKNEIQKLRAEAEKRLGSRYSARAFHEAVMMQGSVPPGYYREVLLAGLAK